MKILITGATGFMGRHLCSALKAHEITEVNSKNCDLTLADSLEQFEQKFDRIYHLAAWTQAGDFCLYHPGEQWIVNQKINTNVLSWWQKHQPQAKLIAMGTSCSYACDAILTEETYLDGTPIDSLYTYAMTKRMLLVGLKALHKQFGLQYLYIVPSTLYGPNYHTDARQLHFIFDLIRKIIAGKYEGECVVLWGDGHQKRELIYIDDFIDALVHLSNSVSNQIVNVGSGQEHTIREFAKAICNYVDYPFEKIEFDLTKHVGAKSKVLKVDLLKQLHPEVQQTPLRFGLEQAVEWFLDMRTQSQYASNNNS
ncbi:MAG: GDP-L-colitose synthase [Chlamydiales bacterium]|nr:GDP-L-colitose synthase [Chlamydiales bacterium]MCH9635079.1 GDP-L-colitose synthase [Chlamydiales bacterium]MCH9703492.1 NAD-dependent epimerase/dehydratase family protein [Chlamydiota bacterium]